MKGHVRERGKGNWYAVIDIRDPTTNKRRRKWHSLQAQGKRAAQIECAGLIAELERGSYVEPAKETLAAFLDRWLADIKARVSPRTHDRYAEIARKNIAPVLGLKPLKDLRAQHISAFYASALESGRCKDGAGLSPHTVLHIHRVLKQALGQAMQWDMIARNPAASVKPPKVPPKPMRTYDLAQTAELLEAMRGTRVFIPVLLALLCGMRRGEIAALRWQHIDLAAAQIAIVQSAEQTKGGVVRYKEPKSGRSRTVALPAIVVDELRVHRIRQAEELLRLGTRLTEDTFVYAREDGLPFQPDSLTQDWDRKIATTGLPRLRFHDLRHAHATHMLAAGVHPKVASERLGHSKIGITLDLYSHVLPNMQADAAAVVDDALRAALNKRETKTK
jgi:integrase